MLLSRVYEQKLATGDMDAIKVLRGVSPVAWRNVQLIGAFDFTSALIGRHRGPGSSLQRPGILAQLDEGRG
ncbi:MAG: hypothetical protein ABI145_10910 [Steroidobacteraceae bacterium]